MTTRIPGLAELALRQQVEIFGRDRVSLDSLWRAAGQPADRDPRTWSRLAAPLLEGFSRYFAELQSLDDHRAGSTPALDVWEGDDGDPWRRGDLMAVDLLARVYASFLDGSNDASAPGDRSGGAAEG